MGTIKDGALYLAPLTAIVRMDPAFSRVDDAEAQDDMGSFIEEDNPEKKEVHFWHPHLVC